MTHTFYKYQGTGNDFVFIDNRQNKFNKKDAKFIAFLCDRRFGIGADGLILLENDATANFKMVYFNADGNESTMCGNGGRCLVAFAKNLNIIKEDAIFNAIDGLHHATIKDDFVKLQMQDVTAVEKYDNHVFLNTGSPHHVEMQTNLDLFDVKSEGKAIRYGAPYHEAGTNVNFVEKVSDTTFKVRTYERGVEDETLSCGTGVTAVALAMHALNETTTNEVSLETKGGLLKVAFNFTENKYTDIWLQGEAKQVFKGVIEW